MKRIAGIAVIALLLSGCAPKPTVMVKPPVEEKPTVARVSVVDLSVEPNHEKLDLTWRKVGQGMISGYNVYISERPLAAVFPGDRIDPSIETYNPVPFPGDTIPEDGIEHFTADKLSNGIRYFVTVRVVYPDGSVSAPSNEIAAVCGGRGDTELPLRLSGGPDGFSFSDDKPVGCADKNNDIYYFSKDGHDYLASPHRLDAFIRQTKFVLLPWKGQYNEIVTHLAGDAPAPSDDKVEVAAGAWILAECTGGTHALINVKTLKGSPPKRAMTISFAYCSIAGGLVF